MCIRDRLGAEFFMKHLYDGDAASNTLGWRWVAGIQTQGKHYLASEWNIKKFTNNRLTNFKLKENANPKVSEKIYSVISRDFYNHQDIENKSLLIFENNLSFEVTDFQNNEFKKVLLVSNNNQNRSIITKEIGELLGLSETMIAQEIIFKMDTNLNDAN